MRLVSLAYDADKLLMEHPPQLGEEPAGGAITPRGAKRFVTTYLLEKSPSSITRFGMLPAHLDLNRSAPWRAVAVVRQEALDRLEAPFHAFQEGECSLLTSTVMCGLTRTRELTEGNV